MSISSSMALTRGGWSVLEQTVEKTFVKIIALSGWTAQSCVYHRLLYFWQMHSFCLWGIISHL